MLSKQTRCRSTNGRSQMANEPNDLTADSALEQLKSLSARQSAIRADSMAIMHARVRYTRIVRELHRLHNSQLNGEFQHEIMRYELLERRVKRQLRYLEIRLGRDIEQRNRLQKMLTLESEA